MDFVYAKSSRNNSVYKLVVPVVLLLPQADYHCAVCVIFIPWICCRSVFSGLQDSSVTICIQR